MIGSFLIGTSIALIAFASIGLLIIFHPRLSDSAVMRFVAWAGKDNWLGIALIGGLLGLIVERLS